ncbi:adenosylcobinamide amidohydrolase [Micromonospora sp. WMMD1102]|uniref:adenosylcobinamide amidohydrolase n=1 Tax=Micromonospora sp. WMMD1102 TaxID=3016105 RepID=UPI002414EFDB|nr:adenosylcobinamide amidohydrolase [Micromonospora sp. WMMD1102]MDG4791284.1 adenosylcobinamide amidohydrolase [Micromonospora sp. WMMD1102]
MQNEPLFTYRVEDGRQVPLLVWQLDRPALAISSGPLGGGIGVRHWVVNATVPMSYRRDDPEVHLGELADRLGLRGPGVGLLTGVDVTEVVATADDGVRVWATVGLGAPIWAAAEPAPTPAPAPAPVPAPASGSVQHVGTVNVVALLPERLGDAALVNAVATITEAKAQALRELGLPATGTATDAVTVLCPPDGPAAPYGGPRSRWGAPLARAACRAVRDGGALPIVPWSHR